MRFLAGARLLGEMSRIAGSGEFDAAIAYWGDGVAVLLNLPKDLSGTRIICDAFSGACNPSALKELMQRGAEVNYLDGLHAKVIIGDDSALVGSANASSNGLAFEADEVDYGLEAAALLTGDETKDVQSWFELTIARSSGLSPQDLKKIETLWRLRRNARPTRSRGTLQDAILRGDKLLRDRRFFVAVTVPDDPPEEVKEKFVQSPFDKDQSVSDDVPYFWDAREWKCRTGDVILSFERDEDDPAYLYDNLWQVQGLIDRGFIIPVSPIKSAFGLTMTKSAGRTLAKKVTRIVDAGEIDGETNLIPIEGFMRLLSGLSD